MRVTYHAKPSYALAVCYLDYGEEMRAESGAMATMSDSIAVSFDSGPGGVVKGLLRKQLGGESFFMARYQATVQDAWVAVAPRRPGDIVDIDLTAGQPGILAETGAFLAMSDGVNVDVKWAGVKNIVMKEGATLLRLHGHGKVLLGTYGGVVEHWLDAGQSIIVDTGHLVAFQDSCNVRVGPLGGVVTSATSGEGLVARITGPGQVWVQSRAETELRSWIMPKRGQN